ncbi:16 kDa beta-galactoside-binding lectin-like [Pseudonaja textilis]|uniref:16 kDa beta-galactoside-binding lectin-like n=1 Tax=Pseudonaja textilis TaxID=8673 RepID=UPI000EAA5F39|nr:16 kDa beta-galactoside-binding lectin-like [Pseudonaja textilis]
MSKCGVTATQFKLFPGESLVVKGTILSDCKECPRSVLIFPCYDVFQITFSFTEDGIRVKTEGSEEIVFPNRLGLNMIDYLAVDGDFRIKSVTFP